MQVLIDDAIKLFNQTKYYEAHEVLEEYWKQLEVGDYKQQIQGVIQCAAALHLLQLNRLIGAQKVWLRAQKNFESLPVKSHLLRYARPSESSLTIQSTPAPRDSQALHLGAFRADFKSLLGDNIDIDKLIHDMYKIFDAFQEGSEINVKISVL